MIKLDDTYSLKHDGKQWILSKRAQAISRKTGKRSGFYTNTYYPNLKLALKSYLDDYTGNQNAESIEDLKKALEAAHHRIGRLHEELKDISYGKQKV